VKYIDGKLFFQLFIVILRTILSLTLYNIPSTTHWVRALDSSGNVMTHGNAGGCEEKSLKQANVGDSQYTSHYLGTCCIQHYYR